MIRVTIELLPHGDETRKKHLGTIEIANDGTGTHLCGNYMVRLARFGKPQSTWIRGVVLGFDRLRWGPYDLLFRALVATIGGRHKALLQMLKEQENEW